MKFITLLITLVTVVYVTSMAIYRAAYNRRIKKSLEGKGTSKKIWPAPYSVGVSIVCLALIPVVFLQNNHIEKLEEKTINFWNLEIFDRQMIELNRDYHMRYFVIGESLDFDTLITDEYLKGSATEIMISPEDITHIGIDDEYFTMVIINDLNGKAELTQEQWNYLAKTVEECNNFGVVYGGDSDYEMIMESGFYSKDEYVYSGGQIFAAKYHLEGSTNYSPYYTQLMGDFQVETSGCDELYENPTDNMRLAFRSIELFFYFF